MEFLPVVLQIPPFPDLAAPSCSEITVALNEKFKPASLVCHTNSSDYCVARFRSFLFAFKGKSLY